MSYTSVHPQHSHEYQRPSCAGSRYSLNVGAFCLISLSGLSVFTQVSGSEHWPHIRITQKGYKQNLRFCHQTTDPESQEGGRVSEGPNGWDKNLWLVGGAPPKKGEWAITKPSDLASDLVLMRETTACMPNCFTCKMKNFHKRSPDQPLTRPACTPPQSKEHVTGLDNTPMVFAQYLTVPAWSVTGDRSCPSCS